jgi:hypothetical protein
MSLPVFDFNVGDTKTITFQYRKADKESLEPITGLIFRFYARDEPGDSAYTIDPVTAVNNDATSEFTFTVVLPLVGFDGFYWIEVEDGLGNIDTFKPAKGTRIVVRVK